MSMILRRGRQLGFPGSRRNQNTALEACLRCSDGPFRGDEAERQDDERAGRRVVKVLEPRDYQRLLRQNLWATGRARCARRDEGRP